MKHFKSRLISFFLSQYIYAKTTVPQCCLLFIMIPIKFCVNKCKVILSYKFPCLFFFFFFLRHIVIRLVFLLFSLFCLTGLDPAMNEAAYWQHMLSKAWHKYKAFVFDWIGHVNLSCEWLLLLQMIFCNKETLCIVYTQISLLPHWDECVYLRHYLA